MFFFCLGSFSPKKKSQNKRGAGARLCAVLLLFCAADETEISPQSFDHGDILWLVTFLLLRDRRTRHYANDFLIARNAENPRMNRCGSGRRRCEMRSQLRSIRRSHNLNYPLCLFGTFPAEPGMVAFSVEKVRRPPRLNEREAHFLCRRRCGGGEGWRRRRGQIRRRRRRSPSRREASDS